MPKRKMRSVAGRRVVSLEAYLDVLRALMRQCRHQRDRDFIESLAMAALEVVRTRVKNAPRSPRGRRKALGGIQTRVRAG